MRIAPTLLALSLAVSAFAADVTGKWNLTAKHPDGDDIKAELIITNEGGKLGGTIGGPEGATPLKDVEFKDNVLTCKLMYGDTPVTLKLTLEGDKLKGNYTTDDGNTGPVEAVRQSAVKADSPVVGVWKIDTTSPEGNPLKVELTLTHDNGVWDGQIFVADFGVTLPLQDVKVKDTDLTCKVVTDNGTFAIEGKVSGDNFDGNSTAPDGTKSKFSGVRK